MNTRPRTLSTEPPQGRCARRRARAQLRWLALVQVAGSLVLLLGLLASGRVEAQPAAAGPGADDGPPLHLQGTGLYAPGSMQRTAPGVAAFSPQYPLWSDGADKRRWLALPAGSVIDASRPDAWSFPAGTRLWKEFAYQGRPVETRFIERLADGSWRFATYVWNDDASDAVLAPPRGIPALPVPQAPGGRYAVPARADCRACHGGAMAPVLGLGALQLSPERDPLAPHGQPRREGDLDLRDLVERGWLRGLPAELLRVPPRIAADTPVERAALGYLHANCSHCHHAGGTQVPVLLTLAQTVADPQGSHAQTLRSAVAAPSRYRPPGAPQGAQVVVPGDAEASVLLTRMNSRHPQVRMPPLGSEIVDPEGVALITRWINQDLNPPQQLSPGRSEDSCSPPRGSDAVPRGRGPTSKENSP